MGNAIQHYKHNAISDVSGRPGASNGAFRSLMNSGAASGNSPLMTRDFSEDQDLRSSGAARAPKPNQRNITLGLMARKIGRGAMGNLGFSDMNRLSHMDTVGAQQKNYRNSMSNINKEGSRGDASTSYTSSLNSGSYGESSPVSRGVFGGGKQYGGF